MGLTTYKNTCILYTMHVHRYKQVYMYVCRCTHVHVHVLICDVRIGVNQLKVHGLCNRVKIIGCRLDMDTADVHANCIWSKNCMLCVLHLCVLYWVVGS